MRDKVDGFNLVKGNKFWSLLHAANALHISQRNKYLELFRTLHNDGVAFNDIKNRLLNEAKGCGYYQRTIGPWSKVDGTGTLLPTYRPFSDCVKAGVAWAVALNNFLSWVSRNWSSYTEEKVATEAVKVPKFTTIITVNGVEKKIRVRGISEEDFESWKGSITRPIDLTLSVDQMVELFKMNSDLFMTEVGNYAQEHGLVDQFNALAEKIAPASVIQ